MKPNAWVLFDTVKKEYLTSGDRYDEWNRSKNLVEARMYFKEQVATQRGRILIGDHHKDKSRLKMNLQVIPLSITELQGGTNIDYVAPARRQGYGVYVIHEQFYRGKWVVSDEGFWNKPPYITLNSNEFRGTLNADSQRGTLWALYDTAQKWADAMKKKEINTRNYRTKITVRAA